MKKYLLYVFIFISCPLFHFGQKNEIDSLKRVLHSQKPDTNKLSILLQLTELNSVSDKKLFLEYNEQSYALAVLLAKSENCIVSRKGKEALSTVFFNISWMHRMQNDFQKAMVFENRRLKLHEDLNDTNAIAISYHNMAMLYIIQKMPSKALPFFLKSLEVRKSNNDKRGVAFIYEQIALVYIDLFDFSKALEYLQKCLVIREELKETNAKTYNSIGLAYDRKGDANKAIEYYKKSLVTFQDLESFNAFPEILERMSNVEYKRKNYDLAFNYADSIIRITKTIDPNSRHRINAEQLLSKIYSVRKNYKEALDHFQIYTTLQDSMDKRFSFETEAKKQMEFEFKRSEDLIKAEHNEQIAIANAEKKKQNIFIAAVIVALLLLLIITLIILRSLKVVRKQKGIIEIKNKETIEQKHLVEEKQKEIIDSISYAKRLQDAILPPQDFVNTHLKNNFIYYQPKDIVAGDFYWAEKAGELFFIASADSTGHGVPGAIVSVVCSNALNRTIKEFKLTETGKILDKTRELVIETFEKSASEVKDGMDISLLCIDSKNKNIYWSGANNPLWFIQDNELKEIKADKQPIGKTEYAKPFTTHQIEYKAGTTFYLFTDGFADQFGGPNGKKFKYKQFSDLLIKNSHLSQKQQSDIINKAFSDWKGDLEQVDDVCVIGIKI